MDNSQEDDYQILVKNFVSDPKNRPYLIDITKMSASYVSRRVLKQDSAESKSELERELTKIKGLEKVDVDKFALNLVQYFFEKRKR